ncbi:MAG: response regulator transcription factor [Eubacteriales bacterium]|nr:response regulator transcription factor [Eubacteriales bacterium]
MTRVLIVDDERNIRKAFRADIEAAGDRYLLLDAITNAADAEMICRSRRVDLVLMDINTAKNESGIEAAGRIKKYCPRTKIIIVTSYSDPHAIEEARAVGADSFWFKDQSPVELIEVMDRTVSGENYWPKQNPDVVLGDISFHELTGTEKEVLYQLVRCISIRKMAETMCIEETTVKYHLKNICQKTGCRNKTELMVLAIQNRLVLPVKDADI